MGCVGGLEAGPFGDGASGIGARRAIARAVDLGKRGGFVARWNDGGVENGLPLGREFPGAGLALGGGRRRRSGPWLGGEPVRLGDAAGEADVTPTGDGSSADLGVGARRARIARRDVGGEDGALEEALGAVGAGAGAEEVSFGDGEPSASATQGARHRGPPEEGRRSPLLHDDRRGAAGEDAQGGKRVAGRGSRREGLRHEGG